MRQRQVLSVDAPGLIDVLHCQIRRLLHGASEGRQGSRYREDGPDGRLARCRRLVGGRLRGLRREPRRRTQSEVFDVVD